MFGIGIGHGSGSGSSGGQDVGDVDLDLFGLGNGNGNGEGISLDAFQATTGREGGIGAGQVEGMANIGGIGDDFNLDAFAFDFESFSADAQADADLGLGLVGSGSGSGTGTGSAIPAQTGTYDPSSVDWFFPLNSASAPSLQRQWTGGDVGATMADMQVEAGVEDDNVEDGWDVRMSRLIEDLESRVAGMEQGREDGMSLGLGLDLGVQGVQGVQDEARRFGLEGWA